jgi:hypothetical protein
MMSDTMMSDAIMSDIMISDTNDEWCYRWERTNQSINQSII